MNMRKRNPRRTAGLVNPPLEPVLPEVSARTRAFSEAVHEHLAACETIEAKYSYLLYLAVLYGGCASETEILHEEAMSNVAFARQMLDTHHA